MPFRDLVALHLESAQLEASTRNAQRAEAARHKNLATTEIYLGELVDVEDVASFLGAYHEIFAAALRGELWDPEPKRNVRCSPRRPTPSPHRTQTCSASS